MLDTDWETISQQSQSNPNSNVKPLDLAYVIYTSGSTGKTKRRDEQPSRNLQSLTVDARRLQLTGTDRVLLKNAFLVSTFPFGSFSGLY
nr:hypothetical protein [Nostoc sp. 'Peltigera malacea cyanobiont' DB3992]